MHLGRVPRAIRVWLALFGFAICTAAAVPALAQGKVHAILLGDTLDPGIGPGAKENLKGMSQLVASIASALGAVSNVSVITDVNFSCANLAKAVKAITTGPDDLVIFYYTGHGFREEGQNSRFPRLWCHGAPPENPLLEEIALGFRSGANPPRMVWAVADACNVTDIDSSALTAGIGAAQQALKKLFGQTSGTLIMAGADMHQFSWYYPTGGQFSKSLLEVMANELRSGTSASWASLIPKAMRPFETPYNNKIFIQQPIYLSTLIEP